MWISGTIGSFEDEGLWVVLEPPAGVSNTLSHKRLLSLLLFSGRFEKVQLLTNEVSVVRSPSETALGRELLVEKETCSEGIQRGFANGGVKGFGDCVRGFCNCVKGFCDSVKGFGDSLVFSSGYRTLRGGEGSGSSVAGRLPLSKGRYSSARSVFKSDSTEVLC